MENYKVIRNLSWVTSFCDLGSAVGCTCSGVDKSRDTCQADDRVDCICNDGDTSGSVYCKDGITDIAYVKEWLSQLDHFYANL